MPSNSISSRKIPNAKFPEPFAKLPRSALSKARSPSPLPSPSESSGRGRNHRPAFIPKSGRNWPTSRQARRNKVYAIQILQDSQSGLGFVQRIKVDAWRSGAEQVLALLRGEIDAETP